VGYNFSVYRQSPVPNNGMNSSDNKGHPCWALQFIGCHSKFSIPSFTDMKLFLYNLNTLTIMWFGVQPSARISDSFLLPTQTLFL
jgi:hypothetical protein